MTKEKYLEVYGDTMFELLENYAKEEGLRLGEIIRNGHHHLINHNKIAIDRLSTCRMILEGRSLIKNI